MQKEIKNEEKSANPIFEYSKIYKEKGKKMLSPEYLKYFLQGVPYVFPANRLEKTWRDNNVILEINSYSSYMIIGNSSTRESSFPKVVIETQEYYEVGNSGLKVSVIGSEDSTSFNQLQLNCLIDDRETGKCSLSGVLDASDGYYFLELSRNESNTSKDYGKALGILVSFYSKNDIASIESRKPLFAVKTTPLQNYVDHSMFRKKRILPTKKITIRIDKFGLGTKGKDKNEQVVSENKAIFATLAQIYKNPECLKKLVEEINKTPKEPDIRR